MEMGWTWRDYLDAPAPIVRALFSLLAERARALNPDPMRDDIEEWKASGAKGVFDEASIPMEIT